MKARRIFISLRGLGLDGGADFGGGCGDNQRCQGQERWRGFMGAIIHGSIHGNHAAISEA
jgi:hypothetical protein